MGSMATAPTTNARPYGGVGAADRLATRRASLLEAGLDLLGGEVPGERDHRAEDALHLDSAETFGFAIRPGKGTRSFLGRRGIRSRLGSHTRSSE